MQRQKEARNQELKGVRIHHASPAGAPTPLLTVMQVLVAEQALDSAVEHLKVRAPASM